MSSFPFPQPLPFLSRGGQSRSACGPSCGGMRPESASHGFSGTPSCGHWVKAAIMASCTASSAEEKSRKRRATAPSTCGASSRSKCSDVASHVFVVGTPVIGIPLEHFRRRSAHNRAYFNRHVQRRTAWAWRGGHLGGNLICSLWTVDIDYPEAGEELFGFGKNAVCDGLAILACLGPVSPGRETTALPPTLILHARAVLY